MIKCYKNKMKKERKQKAERQARATPAGERERRLQRRKETQGEITIHQDKGRT